MRGTVRAIKRDKGYGFIRDASRQDKFFHARNLENVTIEALQEGDEVEFEAYTEEDRGERARHVNKVTA